MALALFEPSRLHEAEMGVVVEYVNKDDRPPHVDTEGGSPKDACGPDHASVILRGNCALSSRNVFFRLKSARVG